MSRRTTLTRPLDAERAVLEDVLGGALGEDVRVSSVARRACEFAGRWPSEILEVELCDGSHLSIFRKEVGLSGHPDKAYPDKEIRMYADVLRGEPLPVPRYFGARKDESAGTHELYIEYIDAHSLKYQGIEHWYRVAAAIARLHGHFANRADELGVEEYLPLLDADYYRAWAQRARLEVDAYIPDLNPRLATLLAGYDEVVGVLSQARRTLVHNDLGSRNAVVDTGKDPPRVCIIDWENAGVGCGVVDLTHLTYGLEDDRRRRLCDAYFTALEGTALAPSDEGQAARLVAAGEVHRVVYRLGRCRRRGYSREAVLDLLAHAIRFRNRV